MKDYSVPKNAAQKRNHRKLSLIYSFVSHSSCQWQGKYKTVAEANAEINSRNKEADEEIIENWEDKKNKVHNEKAPVAVRKLEMHCCNIRKVTAPKIESILYHVYNITMSGSGFGEKIESNIGE